MQKTINAIVSKMPANGVIANLHGNGHSTVKVDALFNYNGQVVAGCLNTVHSLNIITIDDNNAGLTPDSVGVIRYECSTINELLEELRVNDSEAKVLWTAV